MSARKWILVLAICLAAPVAARAQAVPANPVVASAREIFERQSKFITAAADEMPADKYSYHPTADQWSFGKIVSHVATVNFIVCSMLSATPAPQTEKVTETDSKEKIASALHASFDFCSQALGNLQDSQLGDAAQLLLRRGPSFTRCRKEKVEARSERPDDGVALRWDPGRRVPTDQRHHGASHMPRHAGVAALELIDQAPGQPRRGFGGLGPGGHVCHRG